MFIDCSFSNRHFIYVNCMLISEGATNTGAEKDEGKHRRKGGIPQKQWLWGRGGTTRAKDERRKEDFSPQR